MNNKLMTVGSLSAVLTILFAPSTFAHSIFVGHISTERFIDVGDSRQTVSPDGVEAFVSLDINDQWSVNADFSSLSDNENIATRLDLEYEFDSFGVGLNYIADEWALYYQYSAFDEQQNIFGNQPGTPFVSSDNDGNSHSLSASYFMTLNENWQLSATIGLHYNEWDESGEGIFITEVPAPDGDRVFAPMPVSVIESGDASLASVAANINRYSMLNENVGFSFGALLGWNEVLDSQAEGQNILNRNGNTARGRNRGGTINNFLITGGESYGIASLYLSFDFYQNWVVDLDFNTDYGTDDSIQTWSLGVGYIF